MAKQTIGIGTTQNDGTGDNLRVAFDKANDNFTELYDDMPANTDGLSQGTTNLYNQTHTGEVTGSTSLTIASSVVDNDNLAAELKGSTTITGNAIDCATAKIYNVTLSSATTISFSNKEVGMQKILIIDPDSNNPSPVFESGTTIIEGTFSSSSTNYVYVDIVGSSSTLVRIYN